MGLVFITSCILSLSSNHISELNILLGMYIVNGEFFDIIFEINIRY